MNRKQFVFVLIALAIIGGAGLILRNRKQESWTVREARMGDKVMPDFKINDVAALHIKGKDGSNFNVVFTNGLWRVRERNDHEANYHQIRDLLIRLRDAKVVQAETTSRSELGQVDLAEPGKGNGSGTLIEFMDKQGKVIDSIMVGKRHLRPQEASVPLGLHGLFDGCYILLPKDLGSVLLISDDLASAAPEPEFWLSKDFFKIDNIRSISSSSQNAANSWHVSRETTAKAWTLADGKPGSEETLDADTISQTAEMISFLNFTDVVPNAVASQTRMENPVVLTVETFENFSYTIKIGDRDQNENYRMIVNLAADIPAERTAGKNETAEEKKSLDEDFQNRMKRLKEKLLKEQSLTRWVYLVASENTNPLIRDRTQILAKKSAVGPQSKMTDQSPPGVNN
jgi:Domain of unknown function (DUF4340)